MFLAVLQEYIFYNVEWAEIRKMSGIFWAKLYVIFFTSFCWLWDFLREMWY